MIFVHGLWSSPKAWTEMFNDLRADPVLRERYQFWFFAYPTGNPFPYSAAVLRHSLDQARQTFDPAAQDPALDQMVLVGHSMGGLLSRLLIQDSGNALWDVFSDRPFDELKAGPEAKARIRDVLFFEARPYIRRAVFIATPHRGSNLANNNIGRISSSLIRLPADLIDFQVGLLEQNGLDFWRPEYRHGLPTSIDTLEEGNPVLTTLDHLPFASWVTLHSIVGDTRGGRREEGTDNVVPYSSSHLDAAASELVVPDDHSAQDHPEAIREVRRILLQHLETLAPVTHRGSVTAARPRVGLGDPTPARASQRIDSLPVLKPIPER